MQHSAMANLSLSTSSIVTSSISQFPRYSSLYQSQVPTAGASSKTLFTTSATKSGGPLFSFGAKKCEACRGEGAIECAGCKGTGKNKKNGNIFERWKCFDCQGFGMRTCPDCGKGGLTPEQRGER